MRTIWDKLMYFTPKEKWGAPEHMNGALLLCFDALRDIVKQPFVVHCGYELYNHAEKSQHYWGNAVDFHVKNLAPYDAGLKIIEGLLELQLDMHTGLGVYPQWANPGFHLDVRGSKARWGWLDGQQVSFDEAFMLMPLTIKV